jgi:peptidoglycan/LPS O-acetylase OafA/YrhL
MRLGYRPEIDGLRAIAVLIVIFNHLGWKLFSGGYVGVDVFFVISGFLITSILLSEIRDGQFSITAFYKRRIIRLAPAYFLVLAAASALAVALMLPADLLDYIKSALYSTVFLANFYMWKEVGGYFNNQVEFIPLLHLWSLAVEEQFYIFWPLILWLLHKLVPARWLAAIVAVGIVLGVGVSEWGIVRNPAMAYYLMPTRAFELAIGAWLAFAPATPGSAAWRRAMPTLGLALIAVPMFTYNGDTAFPGLHAALPCLGSALLIQFADRRTEWVGRLLSTAPANLIGRISYPAYLWHWPLIAALNICLIPIGPGVAVAVLAVTLGLSYLTYRYAETPAKRLQARPFRKVFGLGYALPALALSAAAAVAISAHGWPQRFPADVIAKSAALHHGSETVRRNCFEGNPSKPGQPDSCILGVNKPGVDLLLIGDSHANHYSGMIDVLAKDAGLRGYDITQSNTIYLPEVHRFHDQKGRRVEHWEFYARNQYIEALLKREKFRYVVLAGSYAKHFNIGDWTMDGRPQASSREIFTSQFEAALRQILDNGAIPVVIKGNPSIKDGSQRCTLENALGRSHADCDNPVSEYRQVFSGWNAYLEQLAQRYPQMIVIDPAAIICDAQKCHTELQNVPIYKDGGHLNYTGSELVGRLYLARFGNPLRPGAAVAASHP